MTLSSRRRSWAPPARSDVISRSAYDNPSSHTASGGCDGLDEMARPLLEREGGVGQPRRHPAERFGALADRRRAAADIANARVDLAPRRDRLLDITGDQQGCRALPIDRPVDRVRKIGRAHV